MRAWYTREILASFVVFLVALPLSLAIAQASNAPATAGVIGAAIGGIVTGALSGAPLQVSGPAAGLSVVMFSLIQQHGLVTACTIVLAAGLFQLAAGAARIGRITLMVPPAVVHGMLAGIGISITLGQLHVVLGAVPKSLPFDNLLALATSLQTTNGSALAIGGVTFGTLVAWSRLPRHVTTRIPAGLVALAAGTGLSLFGHMEVDHVMISGTLAEALQLPVLPKNDQWLVIGTSALVVAAIASAESLLCAVATDKLHDGPRADLDKELRAQGIGNMLSGLLGGLPITGVIVRSSANLSAGAKTRLSAVLHGVWIVLFVTFFRDVVTAVPLAALGAMLIHVGLGLVWNEHLHELRAHGELLPFVVTLAAILSVGLLTGIAIGIALAVLRLVRSLTRIDVTTTQEDNTTIVRISGALTFVSAPRLAETLAKVPPGRSVEVDLCVSSLDYAGYETLSRWAKAHERTGGSVTMDNLAQVWSFNR